MMTKGVFAIEISKEKTHMGKITGKLINTEMNVVLLK